MKRRIQAKAVLLALADRCADDGTNAFPSVATIAAETEVGSRTVDVVLADLRARGLIEEQAAPRQHRPRVWRLSIHHLGAIADPQHVARLEHRAIRSGSQHVAGLASTLPRKPQPADPQIAAPDPQIRESGSHAVADELLNCKEERTTAASPQTLAREPNGDNNFRVIQRLALDLLAEHGFETESDFIAATKSACAVRSIDYGQLVPSDVVHRACASARVLRLRGSMGVAS